MSMKSYIRKATLAPEEGDKIEYMTVRDRLTSNVLVNSQREIPGTACSSEKDVTRLMEVYRKLKGECGYPLPFNTLMMKVLVEGLKAAPRLNAHFEYNHRSTSGRLIIKKHIDVAMAVCLKSGETFQIKLRHLEEKSLEEISAQIEEVKEKLENTRFNSVMFEVAGQRMLGCALKGQPLSTFAQFFSAYFGKAKIASFSKLLKSFLPKKKKKPRGDRKPSLRPDDLTEGTVCFTNWGTLYDKLDVNITYIPPLYPQVFLFGTGKLKNVNEIYRKENGELDLREKTILPITMVFDHKIGGAADLVPFIKRLDEILENPEEIFSW